MIWFYLALLAPLLYAIITLLDDNLLRHVYKKPQIAAAFSGLFGIVPAILILAFGRGALSISVGLGCIALLAGLCTTLAWYFYFRGLETLNPSVVSAILSLTPALLPLTAHFLVGEQLSITAGAGFVIISVSAFVYSTLDTKKFRITKSVLSVLAAALLLDAVALASKYAYERADFYAVYLCFSLGVFVGGLCFVILLRFMSTSVSLRKIYKTNTKKLMGLLALVEIIAVVAEFVHGRAVSLGSVSLVVVMENLAPFYVLLIAVLCFPFFPRFFREVEAGKLRFKFALLLLMLLGVYLIAR